MKISDLLGERLLLKRLRRMGRGVQSSAAGFAIPLGGWWMGEMRRLRTPGRMEKGLAVVLPGIEGRGPLNWCIAQGLDDGGFSGGIIIHDWTTGFWPLFAYHACARGRNRRRAAKIACMILDYQYAFPGRPVHLVGHSGGAALAAWVLEAVPAGHSVDTAILLGPSLSPAYSLVGALRKVRREIWNFWSPHDVIFLAALTALMGTLDGEHSVSAGFRGFSLSRDAGREVADLYRRRLRQRRYSPAMAKQFHLGGHFGWANRVFVAETLAPILLREPVRPNISRAA